MIDGHDKHVEENLKILFLSWKHVRELWISILEFENKASIVDKYFRILSWKHAPVGKIKSFVK